MSINRGYFTVYIPRDGGVRLKGRMKILLRFFLLSARSRLPRQRNFGKIAGNENDVHEYREQYRAFVAQTWQNG